MTLSSTDLGWIAGIVEGEGYIGAKPHVLKNGTARYYPTVQVQMTDGDVIAKFSRLTGATNCRKRGITKSGKYIYSAVLSGDKAVQWIYTLYSLLGERRRAKADSVIRQWLPNPIPPKSPFCPVRHAECHPASKHYANGLCARCYENGRPPRNHHAAALGYGPSAQPDN